MLKKIDLLLTYDTNETHHCYQSIPYHFLTKWADTCLAVSEDDQYSAFPHRTT